MWGLSLSDRYLISIFRAGSEVGLYSVAYNISGKSIDMVVALFMLSMGPTVMNTWEKQGREATESALAMITRLYLILAFPAVIGLTLLAFPLVALLTAKSYHEGYRIVGYIAFSSFAWGLSQIASVGTLIKKQTRRIAFNQIIAAVVNLSLNLVLVPRFGFIAAGVTTLAGYASLLVLQAYASRPYLTWLFPFRTLRNTIIASACMGLTVWRVYALSGNTDGVDVLYLFLSIVVAIPFYVVALWLLGEASEGEKLNIKRFWYRLTYCKWA
jgi:O-antigen/teichoic acid export membrane protein